MAPDLRFIAATLVAVLALSSCKRIDRALTAAEEAERMVEAAINQIQNDSTNWRQTLQGLSEKLPKDVQETVRVEVQQLVERSIAKTGIEFRCDVDFLAQRAVQALQRIKAELLGGKPDPLPPSFCQVSPPELNLRLPSERRERIEFSGYDMDRPDNGGHPVRVLMQNQAGQTKEVPEHLIARVTHYLIVVNSGDPALSRELTAFSATKLLMTWGTVTSGLPQVIVRQWTAQHQTRNVPIGELTFTPPKIGHGDADFDTHDNEPMSVQVEAQVRIDGQRTVQVRVYMHAKEDRSDWTEAGGWSAWSAGYNAPPGWKIHSISPSGSSRREGRINHQGAETWSLPQGELVSSFVVYGDHDDDEAGTWTRVIVHFNAMNVDLEELPPT